MIAELRITDIEKIPTRWWGDVEAIARKKVFKFKPGLNVLWGPNGCVDILPRLKPWDSSFYNQCAQSASDLVSSVS